MFYHLRLQKKFQIYEESMIARFLAAFVFLSLQLTAATKDDPDLLQQEIKHIVVVMLENRSFDNLLGWLYRDDEPLHFIPSASALPFQGLSDNLAEQFANPLKNSEGLTVYSCLPVKGVPSMGVSKWINSPAFDPNEPFPNVSNQIFGFGGMMVPTMLGFVQDYASLWNEGDWEEDKLNICSVMESYTEKQLPVFVGLARHYAISDLWFSSVPTQTNPNRAFSICGTSEGQIVNGWLGKSVFNSDTIWNRLENETPDTTWTIFWQTDMLPVIFPGPFHTPRMFTAMSSISNLDSHYQKLDAFHELARKGELPEFCFIEPQWTFCEGIELEQLKESCSDSDYLVGLQGNDLHPPGDVRTAENFLANIYTSLIANREAWEKTLLVVLFDEHGGIFDHVPPPSALPPDSHFENGFTFDRYGVRTPALFISPRIKKGTVLRADPSGYPFDHTSMIATLLKWKQVAPSKWNMGKRTAVAPTFETVITELAPRQDAAIGSIGPNQDGLEMGDAVLLKDPNGNYLSVDFENYASVGTREESISVELSPSGGKITHGSFLVVKYQDSTSERVLDSLSLIGDCCFAENCHVPRQWWTVKSVDHPYLGYEIKEGDRIYLESHIYIDPLTFVPARLAVQSRGFWDYLWSPSVVTKSIADPEAEGDYWILERITGP